MEIYFAFTYPQFYPEGGFNDIRGISKDKEYLREALKTEFDKDFELLQVVSLDTVTLEWKDISSEF